MPTASTRVLIGQLSGDQLGLDTDEQVRLTEMASRGLVVLPKRIPRTGFQGPALPNRGRLASEMVVEDRR